MPGPASWAVHCGICSAIKDVLGPFPLCRGLSSEKGMSTDYEHYQEICSQWHSTSRNAQILHVLWFLQYYLEIAIFYLAAYKDGQSEASQRPCPESPVLNSRFCSPLQVSKRQTERMPCKHTSSILVLMPVTCCQAQRPMHFEPPDVCDTTPVLQVCS